MPIKVNKVIIDAVRNDGPRKLCGVCRVYYRWNKGVYFCPSCGAKGDAEDVIDSARKVLKADVPTPIIASKKKVVKAKRDADLPIGGQWVRDDTYNPL